MSQTLFGGKFPSFHRNRAVKSGCQSATIGEYPTTEQALGIYWAPNTLSSVYIPGECGRCWKVGRREGGRQGGGRRDREGSRGLLSQEALPPVALTRILELQLPRQLLFGANGNFSCSLPPGALAGAFTPSTERRRDPKGQGKGLRPGAVALGRPWAAHPSPHGQCQQSRRIPGATCRTGRVGGEGRRLWWGLGGSRPCGGRRQAPWCGCAMAKGQASLHLKLPQRQRGPGDGEESCPAGTCALELSGAGTMEAFLPLPRPQLSQLFIKDVGLSGPEHCVLVPDELADTP